MTMESYAQDRSCLGGADKAGCVEQALPNVANKAAVLEFLDPGQTGFGEVASRLLWRETLTAILDMKDRGVVLATHSAVINSDKDWSAIREAIGADPLDLIQGSFHPAAIRLGKTLNAQMVLWGGVIDAGSEVRLQSFLTPIPEVWNPLLEVSLWRRGDRNSSSVAHLP